MPDSTSARIFGSVFIHLAESPTPTSRALALWLWEFSSQFDFSSQDLNCNNALRLLGLARLQDDSDRWIYLGDEGFGDVQAATAMPSAPSERERLLAICRGVLTSQPASLDHAMQEIERLTMES